MLEQIALVRLVPRNLHRRNRPDVQTVNVRRIDQLVDQPLVIGDRGDDQRRPQRFGNLFRFDFDYAGEQEQEFARCDTATTARNCPV